MVVDVRAFGGDFALLVVFVVTSSRRMRELFGSIFFDTLLRSLSFRAGAREK